MRNLLILLIAVGLAHDQCEIRDLSEWGLRQCLYWNIRDPLVNALKSSDPEVVRRAIEAERYHFDWVFSLCRMRDWPPIEQLNRDCATLRQVQLFADLSEWNGWGKYRNAERRQTLTQEYVQWLIQQGVQPREVRQMLRDATKKAEGMEIEDSDPQ